MYLKILYLFIHKSSDKNGTFEQQQTKWADRFVHFTTVLKLSLPTVGHNKMKPELCGPLGGSDLHFNSPQPDTSLHCKTMDMDRASALRGVYIYFLVPTSQALGQ